VGADRDQEFEGDHETDGVDWEKHTIGSGARTLSMSREAQTLSMKEPRSSPEFESVHSGPDRLR
jgi:hypothetical protein